MFDRLLRLFRKKPTLKNPPAIDDRVRVDGGKSTEDRSIPPEQLQKIKEQAVEHGKDEPGS